MFSKLIDILGHSVYSCIISMVGIRILLKKKNWFTSIGYTYIEFKMVTPVLLSVLDCTYNNKIQSIKYVRYVDIIAIRTIPR